MNQDSIITHPPFSKYSFSDKKELGSKQSFEHIKLHLLHEILSGAGVYGL